MAEAEDYLKAYLSKSAYENVDKFPVCHVPAITACTPIRSGGGIAAGLLSNTITDFDIDLNTVSSISVSEPLHSLVVVATFSSDVHLLSAGSLDRVRTLHLSEQRPIVGCLCYDDPHATVVLTDAHIVVLLQTKKGPREVRLGYATCSLSGPTCIVALPSLTTGGEVYSSDLSRDPAGELCFLVGDASGVVLRVKFQLQREKFLTQVLASEGAEGVLDIRLCRLFMPFAGVAPYAFERAALLRETQRDKPVFAVAAAITYYSQVVCLVLGAPHTSTRMLFVQKYPARAQAFVSAAFLYAETLPLSYATAPPAAAATPDSNYLAIAHGDTILLYKFLLKGSGDAGVVDPNDCIAMNVSALVVPAFAEQRILKIAFISPETLLAVSSTHYSIVHPFRHLDGNAAVVVEEGALSYNAVARSAAQKRPNAFLCFDTGNFAYRRAGDAYARQSTMAIFGTVRRGDAVVSARFDVSIPDVYTRIDNCLNKGQTAQGLAILYDEALRADPGLFLASDVLLNLDADALDARQALELRSNVQFSRLNNRLNKYSIDMHEGHGAGAGADTGAGARSRAAEFGLAQIARNFTEKRALQKLLDLALSLSVGLDRPDVLAELTLIATANLLVAAALGVVESVLARVLAYVGVDSLAEAFATTRNVEKARRAVGQAAALGLLGLLVQFQVPVAPATAQSLLRVLAIYETLLSSGGRALRGEVLVPPLFLHADFVLSLAPEAGRREHARRLAASVLVNALSLRQTPAEYLRVALQHDLPETLLPLLLSPVFHRSVMYASDRLIIDSGVTRFFAVLARGVACCDEAGRPVPHAFAQAILLLLELSDAGAGASASAGAGADRTSQSQRMLRDAAAVLPQYIANGDVIFCEVAREGGPALRGGLGSSYLWHSFSAAFYRTYVLGDPAPLLLADTEGYLQCLDKMLGSPTICDRVQTHIGTSQRRDSYEVSSRYEVPHNILTTVLRACFDTEKLRALEKAPDNAADILKHVLVDDPERLYILCRYVLRVLSACTAVVLKDKGSQSFLQFLLEQVSFLRTSAGTYSAQYYAPPDLFLLRAYGSVPHAVYALCVIAALSGSAQRFGELVNAKGDNVLLFLLAGAAKQELDSLAVINRVPSFYLLRHLRSANEGDHLGLFLNFLANHLYILPFELPRLGHAMQRLQPGPSSDSALYRTLYDLVASDMIDPGALAVSKLVKLSADLIPKMSNAQVYTNLLATLSYTSVLNKDTEFQVSQRIMRAMGGVSFTAAFSMADAANIFELAASICRIYQNSPATLVAKFFEGSPTKMTDYYAYLGVIILMVLILPTKVHKVKAGMQDLMPIHGRFAQAVSRLSQVDVPAGFLLLFELGQDGQPTTDWTTFVTSRKQSKHQTEIVKSAIAHLLCYYPKYVARDMTDATADLKECIGLCKGCIQKEAADELISNVLEKSTDFSSEQVFVISLQLSAGMDTSMVVEKLRKRFSSLIDAANKSGVYANVESFLPLLRTFLTDIDDPDNQVFRKFLKETLTLGSKSVMTTVICALIDAMLQTVHAGQEEVLCGCIFETLKDSDSLAAIKPWILHLSRSIDRDVTHQRALLDVTLQDQQFSFQNQISKLRQGQSTRVPRCSVCFEGLFRGSASSITEYDHCLDDGSLLRVVTSEQADKVAQTYIFKCGHACHYICLNESDASIAAKGHAIERALISRNELATYAAERDIECPLCVER